MSYNAILEIPNVVVVSGPAGQSFRPVDDAAELTADFGRDGDRAIIRSNGDEWLKTAGVWAATGENFWGTLLAQGAAQVQQAAASATQAQAIADEFGDLETGITLAQAAAAAAAGNAGQTAADRAQTGADRTQTGLDRTATGADAGQAAADRVATAADRTQTALDRAATGADVGQTAADRIATGADRVATGADAGQTAADRLATGADVIVVEQAKNIVLASGGVPFETTALGIAATTNGQLFEVKGTAGGTIYKSLYKNVAGVATAQGLDVLSKTGAEALVLPISSVSVGPIAITGAGTAVTNPSIYYWPTALQTVDQFLTELKTGMGTVGVLKIVVAKVEVDGSLTLVSSQNVNVATGVSTLTGLAILVPAGCIVGVGMVSGTWYYTPGAIPNGAAEWFTTGVPTTSTPKSIGFSNGVQWQGTFTGEIAGKARSAYSSVAGLLASQAATDLLLSSTSFGPTVITGAGSILGNNNVYFWPSSQSAADRWLTAIKTGMGTAGVMKIVVAHVEADGSLTLVSSQNVNVLTGVSTLSDLLVYVPAGSIVGLQRVSGTWYYTTGTIPNGESTWSTTVVPTTSTPKTSTTVNGLQWQGTFTGEIASKARSAGAGIAAITQTLGTTQTIGWPTLVNTGTDTPANYSVILQTPAAADGYITEVDVGVAASGAAKIHVVDYLGGLIVNVLSSTDVALVNGVAKIPLGIPIAAGKYPAISGGGYKYQPNNNPLGIRAWVRSGVLSNGAVVIDQAAHRFEVAFTLKTALLADAGRALAGSAQNTGLALLADADPNGVVDATAIFASAIAAHPYPYVPPGTFSVTSIPLKGKGFWGPGKVLVNGVLISLPERQEFGSRFLKLRAALMPQIATGSCLIVNGDSISNGAYASNPRTNHAGLLTRFGNMGIAIDEAVLVSFDNADTSGGNAFHGISFSNPSAPTYGANGPVGKSLMLQPAQVINLDAAAYEKVDLTYQGVSGGQLSFAFNGTPYATVNTAATGSDVLAAPGLTGQAASGTYTITNTGAVAIEITSLMRFGIKAVGSNPRLYVCRMAHGSYAMSTFSLARIQSMIRIATAIAGGTNHLVIPALGTNDAVGANLDYAQMRQATLDYAGRWIAAGVPLVNILPIMPWRWSSYGTSNYQNELGGIRQAYRELGTRRVIQADSYDFVTEGLAGDGHPNDAGFIAEFNAIVAALCDGAI